MRLIYTAITILFISTQIFSQNPVEKFTNQSQLQYANISISVKDLKTGKEVYTHRPNHATIPASTMKVITTATALELFGPDYQYQTKLEYDGSIDANGTLNGDLYIVGSGDPTLGSTKLGDPYFLNKWVKAVTDAGIKKINGTIIADESCFDNEGANAKWTWDDIGNYYAPAIYGIAYLDNTLRVTFKSGEVGTKPEIIKTSPIIEGLYIDNNLNSSRIKFDSAYFYGSPRSLTRSVRGEIPANRPEFVVMAELPDPGLKLAQDFQKLLQERNVSVTSMPKTYAASEKKFPIDFPNRTVVYTHLSPTMKEIIKEINHASNNFYAEQVFKSLSTKNYQVASNKLSIDIIANFWLTKGLDIRQLFMADGSGLSPTNAVSANFLSNILIYMYNKSANSKTFFSSLPTAGKNGTVAGFLKNTSLNEKVFVKSGTLTRVKSYSGYIMDGKREWVFTVIVNNSLGNAWRTSALIEQFLVDICK